MITSILRVEILSPTLVEVTPPPSELGTLSQFFGEHGLLAMRQADCVAVEGCWRTILQVVSAYDGDPWLADVAADEVAVPL